MAFSKIYFDVAEIEIGWLKVIGRRLENVDRTHLVLASGKLVPQEISKRTNYEQPKKQKSFNHNFHKVPQRSAFDQVIRLILSPWSLDT